MFISSKRKCTMVLVDVLWYIHMVLVDVPWYIHNVPWYWSMYHGTFKMYHGTLASIRHLSQRNMFKFGLIKNDVLILNSEIHTHYIYI